MPKPLHQVISHLEFGALAQTQRLEDALAEYEEFNVKDQRNFLATLYDKLYTRDHLIVWNTAHHQVFEEFILEQVLGKKFILESLFVEFRNNRWDDITGFYASTTGLKELVRSSRFSFLTKLLSMLPEEQKKLLAPVLINEIISFLQPYSTDYKTLTQARHLLAQAIDFITAEQIIALPLPSLFVQAQADPDLLLFNRLLATGLIQFLDISNAFEAATGSARLPVISRFFNDKLISADSLIYDKPIAIAALASMLQAQASDDDKIKVLDLLIGFSVDLNVVDKKQRSVLHYLRSKKTSLVEFLIKKGFKLQSEQVDRDLLQLLLLNLDQLAPLALCKHPQTESTFLRFVFGCNEESLRQYRPEIIQLFAYVGTNCPDLFYHYTPTSEAPIFMAVKRELFITECLTAISFDHTRTNQQGCSAFTIAIMHGKFDLALHLGRYGVKDLAKTDLRHALLGLVDSYPNPTSYQMVLELVLDSIDFSTVLADAPDRDKANDCCLILERAFSNRNRIVAKALIDRKAPILSKDGKIFNKFAYCLIKLIESNDELLPAIETSYGPIANLYLIDGTPLAHLAINCNCSNGLQYFTQHAWDVNAKDATGNTALDKLVNAEYIPHANQHYLWRMLNLLLDAGDVLTRIGIDGRMLVYTLVDNPIYTADKQQLLKILLRLPPVAFAQVMAHLENNSSDLLQEFTSFTTEDLMFEFVDGIKDEDFTRAHAQADAKPQLFAFERSLLVTRTFGDLVAAGEQNPELKNQLIVCSENCTQLKNYLRAKLSASAG